MSYYEYESTFTVNEQQENSCANLLISRQSMKGFLTMGDKFELYSGESNVFFFYTVFISQNVINNANEY